MRMNFAKSRMVPLNMDEEKAQTMSSLWLSDTRNAFFTYLGLSMGNTKH
jgi:hypothetical protein